MAVDATAKIEAGNEQPGRLKRFWDWLVALIPGRGSSNETLEQQWGVLKQLWSVAKQATPPPNSEDAATIEKLFAAVRPKRDPDGWLKFNDAERRVGAYLTPAQMRVEFGVLLQIATARAHQNLALHTANKALVDDKDKLEDGRAAYAALLDDLQSDFIDGRFRRRLRSEVAGRLFLYGVGALLVALAIPLILVWNQVWAAHPVSSEAPAILTRFSNEPIFAFALVASFGLLGGYFSRAIEFQRNIATLTFDNVMQLYIGRVLRMRMLYGMIGAIVFYFILRGGLVGGSLFPDLARIGLGEHVVWQLTPQGTVATSQSNVPLSTGLTVLAPTSDMAKLLVWSFLAGFSERLVPDALSGVEARANNPER